MWFLILHSQCCERTEDWIWLWAACPSNLFQIALISSPGLWKACQFFSLATVDETAAKFLPAQYTKDESIYPELWGHHHLQKCFSSPSSLKIVIERRKEEIQVPWSKHDLAHCHLQPWQHAVKSNVHRHSYSLRRRWRQSRAPRANFFANF